MEMKGYFCLYVCAPRKSLLPSSWGYLLPRYLILAGVLVKVGKHQINVSQVVNLCIGPCPSGF